MKAASGVIAGLAVTIPGAVALVLAEWWRSMPMLLLATVAVGVASGLGYRFGVQLVNEIAPADRRAALVSGYLVVCYIAISVPVIGLGLIAVALTSLAADSIFGALVTALAISALVLEIVLARRQAPLVAG